MTHREWDSPQSLARMDQQRIASINKRMIDEDEAVTQ
jgi:hypothetical protein